MATLAVTNTFSAGTTIVAADVNQNNDDIEAFVNTTPGVVQNDIVDVLGDLIVASGADAVSRLAAGTNNHVLTADSTVAAHGLKWAAAPTPVDITVADTTDATCFVGVFESATGDLAPKTDGALLYNASTGSLEATVFTGPLTGLASSATTAGACTGNSATATTAGTVTTAAQGAITSVGTLTSVDVTGAVTAGSLVAPLAINPQSVTTYTLVLADAGKMITSSNGSAQTITVPPTGTGVGEVDFAVGTQIIVQNIGSANATLAQGSGVTINSKDSNKEIDGQYAAATLIQTATSAWSLIGALA
jgi:hypothetical protein